MSTDPADKNSNGVQGAGDQLKEIDRQQLKQEFMIPCKVMTEYIKLQALLGNLTIEYVRRNFLQGEILNIDQAELVLCTIDKIRELLAPLWSRSEKLRNGMALTAFEHMRDIINEEEHVFAIPCEFYLHEWSYKQWKKFFGELSHSQYWHTFRDSEDHEPECEVVKKLYATGGKSEPWKIDERMVKQGSPSPVDDWLKESKFRGKKTRLVSQPIEEIDLGDSDESSSGSEQSSITVFTRHRDHAKDVVSPPIFSMASTLSLKLYLEVYERYFKGKFNGGDEECAMELCRFLEGEIKEAFLAVGGPNK